MEETFISKEMRSFISVELAKTLLSRADMRLSCSLEQLRKSTDRAYTMTGFLLTCFTGLTAFMIGTKNLIFFVLALVLWTGISYALCEMFGKVLSIHGFMHTGNSAKGYLQDCNIAYARKRTGGDDQRANELYLKNCLLDSIEYTESAFVLNRDTLTERCKRIDKAMRAIKRSVFIDILIALIMAVAKLFLSFVAII